MNTVPTSVVSSSIEPETDQIVTFQLEDVFVSAQGGTVADATIIIDQIDGLETFPDIVPVAEFVKDFLNNYDGENDFYQTISTNLSQALLEESSLEESSLGLAGTLDDISVQLDRKPSGILPFQFISTATNTPPDTTDQVVTINLQDILVPVQGGTVADATIIVDQKDGLETFPDLIPLANFVEDYLETYPNPNDFYQNISQNLVQDILDEPSLGLSGTLDSISVELDREAAGIVPFSFSSQAIGEPGSVVDPDTDDTIVGTNDADTLDGGGGNDLITGLSGNDIIDGGSGDDRLVGQSGDDTLLGGTGNDRLWGEAGDDLLEGGDGDDFLRGWIGDDTLVGEGGADTFVVEALPGTDTIADFISGEDAIGLKGGLSFADLSVTSDGTDTTIALGGDILAILEGVDVAPTADDFVAV